MLRGVRARDSLDALVGCNLSTEVVPDLGWLIPAYRNAASIEWPELAGRVGIDPDRPFQLERFCGYAGQFELDTGHLKPGIKTVRVTVTGSKGHTSQFTRQITF